MTICDLLQSFATFEVARFSSCVLKSVKKKYIYDYIVIKSLKGFGWNNAGPASQTVAQHYISVGPMYRVIWVVAFLALGG